jgi:DNA-binding NarL/FixJ family response regulator
VPKNSEAWLRILIVEDNASFRTFVRKFIQRNIPHRVEIHECSDGTEALHAYRALEPDWVVMDIRMEIMDGLETARRIRSSDPAAKIIMLTQYSERAYREAAAAIGVWGYVLKDNMHELRRILQQENPN